MQGATTLSRTTLGIKTLIITTLRKVTPSITTLSLATLTKNILIVRTFGLLCYIFIAIPSVIMPSDVAPFTKLSHCKEKIYPRQKVEKGYRNEGC